MINSNIKATQTSQANFEAEMLVQKFYNLRDTFNADYSGKLSRKYEETRKFTITLNHAIFQANQILLVDDTPAATTTAELNNLLEVLKKEFAYLKN